MKSIKNLYVAAAGILVAVGAFVALNGTSVQAVNDYRNCNDDAIVRCGATSEAELLAKYDKNEGDIKNIYAHYGISRSDIAGTTSEVKHGTVYQDGRVVVDGKTVATGAYSLSRVKYTSAGQPRTVTINGTTLYEGPSMAIFVRPVDAFLFFRNGVFYKGILSSCANPLVATPVETPKPPKPEKPVTPKPENCDVPGKEHLPKDSPECEETPVVPETPTTPPTPETPPELPHTGLGTFIGGSLGVGSLTAAGYYFATSRKNLTDALLNK